MQGRVGARGREDTWKELKGGERGLGSVGCWGRRARARTAGGVHGVRCRARSRAAEEGTSTVESKEATPNTCPGVCSWELEENPNVRDSKKKKKKAAMV